MMCTTCFADERALRRDRVDDRDRALDRQISSSMPTSSRELAVQRVDEALADVDAAAGQQPVLAAARLLVPAEQDAILPAEERRDPDARLERHQADGRAEASHAALALRQLVDLDRLDAGHLERRRAARCACRARRRTSRASSVFSRMTFSSPR